MAEQSRQVRNAGGKVELLARQPHRAFAQTVAQGGIGDGTLQRHGQRLRVVGGDQQTGLALAQEFGNARKRGRDAAKALAGGLDNDIGQPVAVAIGGDAAGQHEQVGPAIGVQHLPLVQRAAPDIVITEAFPFGRRQMRFELLPLLEAIAVMRPKPILCCSLRDILQEKTKPGRDAETVDLVLAHYDRVLVHGDPAFARLGDTFPLADRIADRVVHTGLVAPPAPRPAAQGFDVVLSAGGGAVGEGLATAALAAAAELPDLRLCLITGPNLPAGPRQALEAGLNALPQGRLLVETFRPDFAALLAASRLSVSQAGYNTVCDVLQAGCRAILIPFATGGETEQTTRATRLAAKGWADILRESALDGPSLAAAIRQALAAPVPSRQGLDLDGAGRTADILYHLADHRLTEVS